MCLKRVMFSFLFHKNPPPPLSLYSPPPFSLYPPFILPPSSLPRHSMVPYAQFTCQITERERRCFYYLCISLQHWQHSTCIFNMSTMMFSMCFSSPHMLTRDSTRRAKHGTSKSVYFLMNLLFLISTNLSGQHIRIAFVNSVV